MNAISFRFLATYALRRFARIYPLYILYLTTGLLAGICLQSWLGGLVQIEGFYLTSLNEFANQLLLFQGKGVTWSILVEFHYYLFLPLLALAYPVVCGNRLIPSTALTLLMIVLAQTAWPPSETSPNDIRLGPYLPIFFIGALTALIYHRWRESSLYHDLRLRWVVETAGLVATGVLIAMIPSVSALVLNKSTPYDQYHQQFILYSVLWALVLISSLFGTGLLRGVFEAGWLRYLGFVSFSAYLWHELVIEVINRMGGWSPLRGWIIFAITLVLSHSTWQLIERPASRIRFNSGRTKGDIPNLPMAAPERRGSR